jgi:predicted permease
MLHDVRSAIRSLRGAPGFTSVAILTLALGIGGTSAVFSMIRAVFLTPLPFTEPNRLVVVSERRGSSNDADLPVSGHEYMAWKTRNQVFEDVALFRGDRLTMTGSGDPEMIAAVRVSGEYFRVLGLRAARGQLFDGIDSSPGSNRVVVLGDRLWRRRFGGDASIIGRDIRLNDETYTVVGILPPLPESLTTDACLPLDVAAQARTVGRHNLDVVGRLKPGVTLSQSQADLQLISQQLALAMPDDNTDHHAHVRPLRESLVGEYRIALSVLMAAVGFVLLIACANLVNLLLTRAGVRHKEMAVRAALGASGYRLMRLLLVESVLLSVLGGALGVLFADWMLDLIPTIAAVQIPLLETAEVDAAALGVTAVLSLVVGVTIGVAPALRVTRSGSGRWSGEGPTVTSDRGGGRLRALVVASEVAWTLVLLVGAALMLNSFVRLVNVNPGFSTDNVLVMPVDLLGARYAQPELRRAFYDALLSEIRAVPGVAAVGATSHLPLGGADNWMRFRVVGRPSPTPGQELNAAFRVVTPDYFRALGIPLRAGRQFGDGDARLAVPLIRWFPQQLFPPAYDRPQPAPVALISEAAARQFWPGEDPIGRRIQVLFSPDITIVGVVGDVKHNGLNQPAYPHVYLAHNQEPWNSFSVVVRTSIPPAQLAGALREQLREIDPALPATVRPMGEVLSATVTGQRFNVVLIGAFGFVALALATIGVFGVVSHATAQRTKEIGLRLALGAEPRQVSRQILGQGLRPVIAGVFAGLLGALGVSRFMVSLLYGVAPTDPVTFAGMTGLLLVVALVACWIPARSAAQLDPAQALRWE